MTPTFEHFVSAQKPVYPRVLDELTRGQKETHWMWYVFPQLAGLGRSDIARQYGIASLDEARSYLDHPVLGPRLRECAAIVNSTAGRTLQQIFGATDAMKFCSSMTLFNLAAPDAAPFRKALDKYCGGESDAMTIQLLRTNAAG